MRIQQNKKGMALIQAIFFMMFIMAIVSFAMITTTQRNINISGQRMAEEAYPAALAILKYKLGLNANEWCADENYFTCHPLSQDYINSLAQFKISDPSSNLTVTIT